MVKHETIDIIADPVQKIVCRKCERHLDVSGLPIFSKVKCPDCQAVQTVPGLLGNFLLLELLGSGGMGNVYQALDQSLGRYVAIKVMKQTLGNDPNFVENFLREARTAAALNHKNVVQIYSCGQEKGQPYIVMELLDGGRLDEVISQGNPIDEVRAMEIGVDVAEGLKAACDIGLIHGDIKPANVLFDKSGVAKVADFGLARFLKWQENTGEIWGTPYYIAPEKARGQKVDHRSDIYSLGATLYHALGAKPPFDGKTATDVVLARLKNPAISLRVIRPTLQPETADVVARTLEGDPFMRYPTYTSLIADLKEALRVARIEQKAIHRKVKKSPVLPITVIGLVLVTAVVIIVASMKGGPSKQVTDLINTNEYTELPPVATETNDKPPVPAVKPMIQPFDAQQDAAFVAAVKRLVSGSPMGMEAGLQRIYDETPPETTGRLWAKLFQYLSARTDGREKDSVIYLRSVRDADVKPLDENTPHPGNMAQMLSKFVLKEADDGMLNFEISKWAAAPWYADLVEFFVGYRFFVEGNYIKADEHFSIYLNKRPQGVSWPYSLQPLAKQWSDFLKQFNVQSAEARKYIDSNQPSKAREAWEKFRADKLAMFYPMIDRELNNARMAERQDADERVRSERKSKQGKVIRDLEKIEEVRAANLSFVAQKDYRKASAALSKILPELTTTEGQQYFQHLREMYERMDALKKYLMTEIPRKPFRQGMQTELGGDAVNANLSGITITLGSHGEMLRPWQDLSIRMMIQLITFYVSDPTIKPEDRADKWISIAALCYENGALKPAAGYADQAIKQNPNAATKIRQLMPGLIL